GWPSARAASASSASRSSGEPRSAFPAAKPPTHAAALEPSPRASGTRFTHSSRTPRKGRPAVSYASLTPRTTMLSASFASSVAPSPRRLTSTRSASSATTSLWRASASPRASNPGPRLADVAGTRMWMRTRLEPLEEPVGRERHRPRVEQHVLVGEDEHADDDETEDDDQEPADPADPHAIVEQELAEHAERGPERDEDDPEPDDEGERVEEHPPPRGAAEVGAEVGNRHPRDERDVRGEERQHAGGEEREEPRAERDDDAERLAHGYWRSPSISASAASPSQDRGPSASAAT